MPNIPIFLKGITMAQILAVLGWVGAQAVAYGWIDGTKEKLVLSAAATIVAVIWKLADAWIQSNKLKAATAAWAAGKTFILK